MANTSIDLVGLDFQTIKTNLKTYLKNNTAFKDVDFEGSNINVLIDLLAYNTYMNSFYTNMVASEMFIDTAQLRDSVVSHAKALNYVPDSFVSARAEIALSITPTSSPASVVIPKGTTFTSRVGSNTYTFSTAATEIISSSNNGVFSSNVMLYEGTYVADSFTVNSSNTSQRFVLSNPTIDISSVSVTVVEDSGATSLDYTKTETLIGVTSASRIYFVEAAENQQYEIRFGDGVFGRKPKDGSVIIAEYRTSSGELPNGASTFTNDGNIDGNSNVAITTISSASGGSISETIESIKYNAPRSFQTQGRAVTASDYETLLKANFADIQSIAAYGGETLTPPQFGKVFISVDVMNADGTPQNRIQAFNDFIKTKTPLTIDPVFVNPEFMYVQVVTNVKYNVNTTSKLSNDIQALVFGKISNYNLTNLNGFKTSLYYSKLVKEIDAADASIVSNDTFIKAIRTIRPTLNTPLDTYIDYGFPLEQEIGVALDVEETHYGHTIISSAFTFEGERCVLVDDTKGTLYIAKLRNATITIIKPIGSVDYANGIVTINGLNVSAYEGAIIKLYATSRSSDIASSKNVILSIADEDISVTITPVKL